MPFTKRFSLLPKFFLSFENDRQTVNAFYEIILLFLLMLIIYFYGSAHACPFRQPVG